MIRLILTALLAGAGLAGPAGPVAAARAQAPATAEPDTAHARVMALIRAGETETALAAARRLSASPDADPVLLYNQACLEARLGQ
ncbi:MAG: hypothetical protein ABR506_09290, partial [Candidatus Krumholzibacteriia bacterium]